MKTETSVISKEAQFCSVTSANINFTKYRNRGKSVMENLHKEYNLFFNEKFCCECSSRLIII